MIENDLRPTPLSETGPAGTREMGLLQNLVSMRAIAEGKKRACEKKWCLPLPAHARGSRVAAARVTVRRRRLWLGEIHQSGVV